MTDTPVCCERGPTVLGRGVRVYWAASEATHLVVWVTPSGKRRKKRAQAHADAMDGAHQVLTQLGEAATSARPSSEAASAPRTGSTSIPSFVERWIEDHRVKRDWSLDYVLKLVSINKTWVQEYLDLPVSTWCVADTVALFTVMEQQGRSRSQQKSVLSLLRQSARYAQQLGLLDRDPCLGIVVRERRRSQLVSAVANASGTTDYVDVSEAPSTADVERLAQGFTKAGDDPLIALLTAYCGLRWGEVFALERGDFDLESGTVEVVRRVDPKAHARNGDICPPGGGHPRYWRTRYGYAALPKSWRMHRTFVPDHLREALAERPDGLLFPNGKGKYRTNASQFYDKVFEQAREAAGWPRGPDGAWLWTIHSLRHHAASWMLNELKLPLTHVASVLGHASADVTMRIYAHADGDAAEKSGAVTRGWKPPSV